MKMTNCFSPAILAKVPVTAPSGGDVCREGELLWHRPLRGAGLSLAGQAISSLSLKRDLELPSTPTGQ